MERTRERSAVMVTRVKFAKKLNTSGSNPFPFFNEVPDQRNFARFLNDSQMKFKSYSVWIGWGKYGAQ